MLCQATRAHVTGTVLKPAIFDPANVFFYVAGEHVVLAFLCAKEYDVFMWTNLPILNVGLQIVVSVISLGGCAEVHATSHARELF